MTLACTMRVVRSVCSSHRKCLRINDWLSQQNVTWRYHIRSNTNVEE